MMLRFITDESVKLQGFMLDYESLGEQIITIVGFTRIAVNFKFHSWFRNFKLT